MPAGNIAKNLHTHTIAPSIVLPTMPCNMHTMLASSFSLSLLAGNNVFSSSLENFVCAENSLKICCLNKVKCSLYLIELFRVFLWSSESWIVTRSWGGPSLSLPEVLPFPGTTRPLGACAGDGSVSASAAPHSAPAAAVGCRGWRPCWPGRGHLPFLFPGQCPRGLPTEG